MEQRRTVIGLRSVPKTTLAALLVALLALSGCYRIGNLLNPPAPSPGTDQARNQGQKPPPAIPSSQDAQALVESFVRARLARDENAAKGFMTPGAGSKLAAHPVPGITTNIPLANFALADRGPVTGGRAVAVVYTETQPGQPFSRVTEETVTVGYVSGSFKIVDLAADLGRRVSTAHQAGVITTEGPAKTPSRTIRLADLPNQFGPQGGEPDNRFGIGKDGFGPLALSPDFRQLAITTRGTHAFLAVYRLAEGSLTGIDLYYGGGVSRDLYWSPDSRYLAVPIDTAAGTTRTDVYDLTTVKKLGLNRILFQTFPTETYSFVPVSWSPIANRLILEVTREDKKQDDKTGRWMLNVPPGELSRAK